MGRATYVQIEAFCFERRRRVAPLYHEAGLPLVAPIVSNPKLTESGWSNVFRFTNRDDATANAIAGYMTRCLQKNRAVVVETDTTYGRSMSSKSFARLSARTVPS
jgi:branched-chain amino acid transport system substrate-binding protein